MKKLIVLALALVSTALFSTTTMARHYHHGGVYFYYGPGYYAPYGYNYYYYQPDRVYKRCWRHHGRKYCRYYERSYWGW